MRWTVTASKTVNLFLSGQFLGPKTADNYYLEAENHLLTKCWSQIRYAHKNQMVKTSYWLLVMFPFDVQFEFASLKILTGKYPRIIPYNNMDTGSRYKYKPSWDCDVVSDKLRQSCSQLYSSDQWTSSFRKILQRNKIKYPKFKLFTFVINAAVTVNVRLVD